MAALRRLFKIWPLISMSILASCTGAGFFVVNLPASFEKDQMTLDVVYDGATGQKLDIYRPKVAAKDNPVLIFFYGGRWETGDKKDYRFVAARFAQAGYTVVIPDYRKYPAVKFPAFVEDGAAAVAWIYGNIAKYGGNPRKLYLAGHSSGAHIASLLVTDNRYLYKYRLAPANISAFAGLAGPYSFTPEDADLVDMFGPGERFPQMQATNFISGGEPPMLLLWGEDDKTVGRFNHERLADVMRVKGANAKTITYPGVDHIDIVVALSWVGKSKASVADDMIAFFRAHP